MNFKLDLQPVKHQYLFIFLLYQKSWFFFIPIVSFQQLTIIQIYWGECEVIEQLP